MSGTFPDAGYVGRETQYRLDTLLVGVFCRYLMLRKPEFILFLLRYKFRVCFLILLLLSPAFFFIRAHPINYLFGFVMLATGFGLLLLFEQKLWNTYIKIVDIIVLSHQQIARNLSS